MILYYFSSNYLRLSMKTTPNKHVNIMSQTYNFLKIDRVEGSGSNSFFSELVLP